MLKQSESEGGEMDLISMSSLGHHETAVTISAAAARTWPAARTRALRAPLVPHPAFNTTQSNKRRNVAESILLHRWREDGE